MIIRDAEPGDARQIAEVHVASWQSAYAGLIPDSELERLSVNEREYVWNRRLTGNRSMFPVLVDQGRVVGWAVVGPSRDPDCDQAQVYELYGIYFLESYWGGGYGKRLYRAAEQRIVAAAKEIKVWGLEGNARARRFYESIGFTIETNQRKEIPFGSKLLAEVRYRKVL